METKNSSQSVNENCFTYQLDIDRKHGILVTEEGKRYLIDTGSPVSFTDGPLYLCGRLQESNTGGMINHIRKVSNLDIDGLIGMATLRQYPHILFDYPHNKISFSTKSFNTKGYTGNIYCMFGMAIFFDAKINGSSHRIILDSGAPISYIKPDLVKMLTPITSVRDFHPEIGEFDVPIYPELELAIGDACIPISFGVLPSTSLVSLSTSVLADCIVGYDLLKHGKVELSFSSPKPTMTFEMNPLNTL